MSAVNINFPLDVTTWTWHAKRQRWLRYYSDTGPAIQGDNVQLSAANVVVLHVVEYATGYVEDPTGALENELRLTGSGPAEVFRNGTELRGTWHRPTLAQATTFTEADGTAITLTPGNTWEELVPTTSSITAKK